MQMTNYMYLYNVSKNCNKANIGKLYKQFLSM